MAPHHHDNAAAAPAASASTSLSVVLPAAAPLSLKEGTGLAVVQSRISAFLLNNATGANFLEFKVDKQLVVQQFGKNVATLINNDIKASKDKIFFGSLNGNGAFVERWQDLEFYTMAEKETSKHFWSNRRMTLVNQAKTSAATSIPTGTQLSKPENKTIVDSLNEPQHVTYILAVEESHKTLYVKSYENKEDAMRAYSDFDFLGVAIIDFERGQKQPAESKNIGPKKRILTLSSLSVKLGNGEISKQRITYLPLVVLGEEEAVEIVAIYGYTVEIILNPLRSAFVEYDDSSSSRGYRGRVASTWGSSSSPPSDRIEDDSRFSSSDPPPTCFVSRSCCLTSFKSGNDVCKVIKCIPSVSVTEMMQKNSVGDSMLFSRKELESQLLHGKGSSEDTLSLINQKAILQQHDNSIFEDIWAFEAHRELIRLNDGISFFYGSDSMFMFTSLSAIANIKNAKKKSIQQQFSMDSAQIESRLSTGQAITEFSLTKKCKGG